MMHLINFIKTPIEKLKGNDVEESEPALFPDARPRPEERNSKCQYTTSNYREHRRMRDEDKKDSCNRSSAEREPLLLRYLKSSSRHYGTPVRCLHCYLTFPINECE